MPSLRGRQILFGFLGCMALGMTVLAQSLPKLPPDLALPQGKDSPGKVVFSHVTHVDQAKPECTVCHPTVFRLVNPQITTGRERLVHEKMAKGAQCGMCHNGKDARGFDDCTMCHRTK